MSRPPATWLADITDLAAERPDLAGIGLTDITEVICG